ncbi:nucleotide exchange factor GrpE [Chitinophagaceae bacterium LB-8]|uniref:Protein GrpE n=1 Tax=Paraflavisolibacter caeni TaxID=2982496 RepID=A0A9X2XNN2_9BACT|nr:nucleotide exchange factor GrpE [Paraflavisolibacter caeni]MCU7548669.1 nucleotide exchange factor GrpE [Paraflavisolibacter caeni]
MKHKDFKEKESATPEQTSTQEVNMENTNQTQTETVSEGPEVAEVAQLKAQVDELKDKYLRQAAEFDNFRRRTAKERIELIQTAGRDVIESLLEVLDDSERAQKQLEEAQDINQIKEGVLLVFNKLRNTLTAKGLKPMDAKGKEFNPDLHEAITEIEVGEEMKGKVVDEVIKGYYLNDKIIRFAKVVVGK